MTDPSASQSAQPMTEFLQAMVQALVDSPESVRVQSVGTTPDAVLKVLVRDEDLERLQGKNGRTARSLRTIVAAAGQRAGSRLALDIGTLE